MVKVGSCQNWVRFGPPSNAIRRREIFGQPCLLAVNGDLIYYHLHGTLDDQVESGFNDIIQMDPMIIFEESFRYVGILNSIERRL